MANKNINLQYLTDGFMMTPTRTVTAFIGVIEGYN